MGRFFDRNTIIFIVACCLLGGIYGLVQGYSKARTPAEMRRNAIAGGQPACVKQARATMQEAAGTKDDAVERYCTCAVTQSVNALSDQQMLAAHDGKTSLRQMLGDRYEEIIGRCAAEAHGEAVKP